MSLINNPGHAHSTMNHSGDASPALWSEEPSVKLAREVGPQQIRPVSVHSQDRVPRNRPIYDHSTRVPKLRSLADKRIEYTLVLLLVGLVRKTITVELRNDTRVQGRLDAVDDCMKYATPSSVVFNDLTRTGRVSCSQIFFPLQPTHVERPISAFPSGLLEFADLLTDAYSDV